MGTRNSKALVTVVSVVAIGVFCLLAACGQPGNVQGSSVTASSVNLTAISQSIEGSLPDEHEAYKLLLSTVRKTKMSFFDALGEAFGKAKDKAEDAVDAVNDAKDEAGRKLSEWQEQREEAERAKALELLEKAELTKKEKTLEYSTKKANPLKQVECSDSRVEVTADGKIDRSKPGTRKVVYTLSYGGQSVERVVKFKVRDTKVPQIDFKSTAPKVDLGAAYDPIDNINFVKDSVDGNLERVEWAPEAQGTKAGAEVFYDKGWYTVAGYVDTSVEGVYTISVDASDIHGNTKHRTFDVTVAAPAPEPEEATTKMMTRSISEEPTVYVTEYGKKYHAYGCRYLKDSCIPIPLSEAKRNYDPCSVCGV